KLAFRTAHVLEPGPSGNQRHLFRHGPIVPGPPRTVHHREHSAGVALSLKLPLRSPQRSAQGTDVGPGAVFELRSDRPARINHATTTAARARSTKPNHRV